MLDHQTPRLYAHFMYAIKQVDCGWAIVHEDTEEVAFIDDCPQTCMSYDDAVVVAASLNKLEEIKARRGEH